MGTYLQFEDIETNSTTMSGHLRYLFDKFISEGAHKKHLCKIECKKYGEDTYKYKISLKAFALMHAYLKNVSDPIEYKTTVVYILDETQKTVFNKTITLDYIQNIIRLFERCVMYMALMDKKVLYTRWE